jgi:tetratricopeptide (TPR) repeat protein
MTPVRGRVVWTLALLIPLCAVVGVASLVTRSTSAPAADPILGCALLRGPRAVEACDEVMHAPFPTEIRAEAAYKKGVELGGLARYGDAVDAYRVAIHLQPDYVDAHYNLGVALAMLDRPGEAFRAFRATVQLAATDADAHYNLGLALNRLGRHTEAVQAYREAVRVRPDYADAWGNLGLTTNLIGQYRESVDAFERANALLPAYFDSRPRQRDAFEASRRDRSLYSVAAPR